MAVAPLTGLTADYDYNLPPELIAQEPPADRLASRLLVLDRTTGEMVHRRFTGLADYVKSGDCLVVNETRVRPARLSGRKSTGAKVELLLLTEVSPGIWEVLCKPAKRLAEGARIIFGDGLAGWVVEVGEAGKRLVRFDSPGPVSREIERFGSIALPPYIRRPLDVPERYQTVFAAPKAGSVAAPTAGLHFTREFLQALADSGVAVANITLDIGLDTFRPIQSRNLDGHKMHSEVFEIPEETARIIAETRAGGGRVLAVGTTTVRALESAAAGPARVLPGRRPTDLFIRPGFDFQVVDLMLTNFHLPKSTLIVLVSAFAGRKRVLKAYAEAIRERYRFYSFGDAMLII